MYTLGHMQPQNWKKKLVQKDQCGHGKGENKIADHELQK